MKFQVIQQTDSQIKAPRLHLFQHKIGRPEIIIHKAIEVKGKFSPKLQREWMETGLPNPSYLTKKTKLVHNEKLRLQCWG